MRRMNILSALAVLALAFAAFAPRESAAAEAVGSDGPPAEVSGDAGVFPPPPPAPALEEPASPDPSQAASRTEDVAAEEPAADRRGMGGFAAAGIGIAALLGVVMGTRRRATARRRSHHGPRR